MANLQGVLDQIKAQIDPPQDLDAYIGGIAGLTKSVGTFLDSLTPEQVDEYRDNLKKVIVNDDPDIEAALGCGHPAEQAGGRTDRCRRGRGVIKTYIAHWISGLRRESAHGGLAVCVGLGTGIEPAFPGFRPGDFVPLRRPSEAVA